jgi:hypothetical protein
MDVIAGRTAGLFAAVCLVLAFAGVSKVRRPLATQPAAAALGLPRSRAAVRALGAIEVATSVVALLVGGPAAAAVAVVYGALAIAAWRLLVRAPGTACGCLGASDAPVTALHIVVNVVAMVVAVLATSQGSPFAAAGDSIWARGTFIVLVVCCASLVTLLLDTLPALSAAMREGGSR